MKNTYNMSIKKLDQIADIVCEKFNVDMASIMITSKNRKHRFVLVRQMIMAKQHQHTRFSLSDIGARHFNKDHATVLHAIKTIKNLEDTDKFVLEKSQMIDVLINNLVTPSPLIVDKIPQYLHV